LLEGHLQARMSSVHVGDRGHALEVTNLVAVDSFALAAHAAQKKLVGCLSNALAI
jgi:hypothetical protein